MNSCVTATGAERRKPSESVAIGPAAMTTIGTNTFELTFEFLAKSNKQKNLFKYLKQKLLCCPLHLR